MSDSRLELRGMGAARTAGTAVPERARAVGRSARAVAYHFWPFAAVAVLYSLLPSFEHARGRVRVAELRALDLALFAVGGPEGTRTLGEAIASASNPVLDVVCGATYFFYLLEIVALAVYFYVRERPKALEVSVGFLALNVIGWAVWVIYPAAPPWYVDVYGTGAVVQDAASNPAALSRLDALMGLPYFSEFYSNSRWVFGAMPSLHVSYATAALIIAWRESGVLRAFTAGFALCMAYAAVYLKHHWVVDVLAGALLAVLVAPAVRWVLARRVAVQVTP